MAHPLIERLLGFLRSFSSDSGEAGSGESGAPNRREHERFQYSYRVTIFCDLKKFETVCTDISLGGMRLKNPLPPSMLGRQCKVSISDHLHREPIVFSSTVIADAVVPRRISFSGTDRDAHERLKSWLKQRVVSELIKGDQAQ